MKKLFLICALAFSTVANATVWEGGDKRIANLRFNSSGALITFDPPLANCNGGTNYGAHANLLTTHLNYKGLVSALLVLKTTQEPVNGVWVSNEGITCNSTSVLQLETISF